MLGSGFIICAGLSCLDLQLVGCTNTGSEETIETYDKSIYCAGGSASMTATTLGLLFRSLSPTPSSSGNGLNEFQIHILTKLGDDFNGSKMIDFYQSAGAKTDLVLIDPTVQTSMAVLPVYTSGKRGCFVNLACNEGFTPDELLGRIDQALTCSDAQMDMTTSEGSFLFGYPHLLQKMQGEALKDMLKSVRSKLARGKCLIGVDLNGVSVNNHHDSLLHPALGEIDILHLNEEEASIILSNENNNKDTNALHSHGCAVVVLSLGSRGARITVTSDENRLQKCPGNLRHWTPGEVIQVPAFHIDDGEINTNGAGDALFAGFCLAATWRDNKVADVDKVSSVVSAEQAGIFASLVAWQRCNVKTRDGQGGMKSAEELMNMVMNRMLPKSVES